MRVETRYCSIPQSPHSQHFPSTQPLLATLQYSNPSERSSKDTETFDRLFHPKIFTQSHFSHPQFTLLAQNSTTCTTTNNKPSCPKVALPSENSDFEPTLSTEWISIGTASAIAAWSSTEATLFDSGLTVPSWGRRAAAEIKVNGMCLGRAQ